MTGRILIPWLDEDSAAPFPPTGNAMKHPNGLLAAGGDLASQRLLNAYRHGIFPWYTEGGPILWWSPAPRCVIYPSKVHLSRRTRRRFNSGEYRLTVDGAFREVIAACAQPREYEEGTWITAEMEAAYTRLHELGRAHSLEVWLGDELIGGIYGLALGAAFFGESMFNRATDASKIALVALCRLLEAREIGLLDCQVGNPHLFSMGAELLSRAAFESELSDLLAREDRFTGFEETPAYLLRW